jgi:hypothetical protein
MIMIHEWENKENQSLRSRMDHHILKNRKEVNHENNYSKGNQRLFTQGSAA